MDFRSPFVTEIYRIRPMDGVEERVLGQDPLYAFGLTLP
jgi:hypothetical protein